MSPEAVSAAGSAARERDPEDLVTGTLLGTALGDALGLSAEGMSAAALQRPFGTLDRFRLLGRTGFVSDDTEQSALVAQCLVRARTASAEVDARALCPTVSARAGRLAPAAALRHRPGDRACLSSRPDRRAGDRNAERGRRRRDARAHRRRCAARFSRPSARAEPAAGAGDAPRSARGRRSGLRVRSRGPCRLGLERCRAARARRRSRARCRRGRARASDRAVGDG